MSSPASPPTHFRMAILLGSMRKGGNGAGIAAWIVRHLQARLKERGFTQGTSALSDSFSIEIIDPTCAPHPLGPMVDSSRIPAQLALVMEAMPELASSPADGDAAESPSLPCYAYSSPSVRSWSRFVLSLSGLCILTPQYNWGYPGELKTALDHLYHEWQGMPLMLATYGGHGGVKADEQLRQVTQGGLKMSVVERRVNITLPKAYIREGARVDKDGADAFLAEFEAPLIAACEEWIELMQARLKPAASPPAPSS